MFPRKRETHYQYRVLEEQLKQVLKTSKETNSMTTDQYLKVVNLLKQMWSELSLDIQSVKNNAIKTKEYLSCKQEMKGYVSERSQAIRQDINLENQTQENINALLEIERELSIVMLQMY